MAIEHHRQKQRRHVRIIFPSATAFRGNCFKPTTEPGPHVRFLDRPTRPSPWPGNAIWRKARSSVVRISRMSICSICRWRGGTTMPRDFTHDYLCGHFHTAGQVIEVFRAKREIGLTFAHLGRWLWPNVMAANSLSRPAFALQPEARDTPKAGASPAPPDPDRLLTLLSDLMALGGLCNAGLHANRRDNRRSFCRRFPRYYLAKLRRDCADRGIRLHACWCPVSKEKTGIEFV